MSNDETVWTVIGQLAWTATIVLAVIKLAVEPSWSSWWVLAPIGSGFGLVFVWHAPRLLWLICIDLAETAKRRRRYRQMMRKLERGEEE